jgi:trimethylamine--corrinoid protein Co-methyltransferase
MDIEPCQARWQCRLKALAKPSIYEKLQRPFGPRPNPTGFNKRRIISRDPAIKHFKANPLDYLSPEQMGAIHSASLEILVDIGTIVHHEGAVDLLKSADALVRGGNRVFLSAAMFIMAPDIPVEAQYQQKYAVMIRNSIKPQVITASNRSSLNDIVEIAAAVVGSRAELSWKPLFVLYDEPTSPLVHTTDALDKPLFMAENRLPINYSPGSMAGGTSPITMAGSIAQANAEILAGLVIHQLKNPGAPFIFGGGMSPMDMQSMQPTYSAPEAMVERAGLCQLGRSLYHLPTWGFGGCSASKLADEQAVNEAATYILKSGLMGTNLVHDVGYLEFGLTFSFDLLVMCDEFIGQVRRMMEGIRVDRQYLAADAVKRVGPGGHFLLDDHSLEHFRENWKKD